MIKAYIGIDLSAKSCVAAVINRKGEQLSLTEFPTSEHNLKSFMERQERRSLVLLEECDLAHWARMVILPYAQEVDVADPKHNAWIYKDSVKNDKIDARKLAQIALLGNYNPIYHQGTEDIYSLRLAVKSYDGITKKITAQKNQIKAKLRGQGIIREGSKVYGKKGRLEALSLLPNPQIRAVVESDYRHLDFLVSEKVKAKRLFLSIAKDIPIVRAYEEMPGIGPVLASRFCAYVVCPSRFPNSRKLWRYAALGVTNYVSAGKQLKRQHLDPMGNHCLKDLSMKAFLAAMRTKGDNRFKRAYANTLAHTGNADHARLTCQRKILAVMLAMWKDGTPYDDGDIPSRWA